MMKAGPINLDDADSRFWLLSLIFGVMVISIGSIATGQSVSAFTIYLVMFISTWIPFLLVIATKNNPWGDTRAYGGIVNDGRFLKKDIKIIIVIASGLLFGIVLGSKQLFGVSGIWDFSIILPAAAAFGIGAGFGFQAFVDAYMAPLLEDTWREGVLRPSLEIWIQRIGVGPILFITGGLAALLLYSSGLYWIGVIILVAGALITFVPKFRDTLIIKNSGKNLVAIGAIAFIAASISSILWAALHVFAYGQVQNFGLALLNVFVLGMLIALFNTIFWKSIIFGLIAHSTLNSILVGTALGISGIATGLMITAFLAISLYMLSKKTYSNSFKSSGSVLSNAPQRVITGI